MSRFAITVGQWSFSINIPEDAGDRVAYYLEIGNQPAREVPPEVFDRVLTMAKVSRLDMIHDSMTDAEGYGVATNLDRIGSSIDDLDPRNHDR